MKRITLFSATLVAAILFCHPLFSGNNAASDNTKKSKEKHFRLAHNITPKDYVSNTIIFKLKTEQRSKARAKSVEITSLNLAFAQLGVKDIGKIYPNHQAPAQQRNSMGIELVDLSLIYELTYASNVPIEKAANRILATGMVEYAEPKYLYFTNSVFEKGDKNGKENQVSSAAPFMPNDPDLTNGNMASMYYIKKIKCDSAWGINTTTARGDPNVVIGIVDSGCDWDHPDCASQVKTNAADPIDGLDNDNDGYIDNFRGWDLSMNDNDPMNAASDHGSHVAGLAAATTNNGVGVAGTGFNCKFLPIKCSRDTSKTAISNGYEGITYAADHGCKVINCSWGGSFGGSYGQDIITYAAINKDATIVAGAGNDGVEKLSYPAAFDYVLSVANTGSNDVRAGGVPGGTTFGTWVDISAPGLNVRSTVYNNGYTTKSGTSMASPVAAGAVAIVRSFYPSLNALQAAEQLRVTTDYHYNIGANTGLKDKLGSGRVNLYRALSGINKPSVRMTPLNISDGNDNVWVANDTLKVTGNIFNYLAATTNLKATLTCTNTAVTIINPVISVGALGTLANFMVNTSNQWRVKINGSAPANTNVDFKIVYQDGSTYSDYQYFSAVVNVDYVNININDIGTTNTSRSSVGWNNVDLQSQGLGFAYKDSALLFEGGLMVGINTTSVSDNIRSAATGAYDMDFQSMLAVRKLTSALKSDMDTYGKFNDNGAAGNKLPITVTHRTYAWSQPAGERKYVIFEYVIQNTGASSLSNLRAGMFADWDITSATSNNNKADTDPGSKLGYVYSLAGSKMYAGIRLLTSGAFNHYAIDNDGTGDTLNIYDGYAPKEKYNSLSVSRPQSGSATGGDMSSVVSAGPFTVNASDSIKVAFALIAGDNLNDLKTSGNNAQMKYDAITGVIHDPATGKAFGLHQNFPNPVNADETIIGFYLDEKSSVDLSIYDAMGKKVMNPVRGTFSEGKHQYKINVSGLADGIYFYQLNADGNTRTMKMIIVR